MCSNTIYNYLLQARCPERSKKTDRVRTPLDVLTRANEAVAQGGTYTRVAKEISIDRMKCFIRKQKLHGPATYAGYEYLSRLKIVINDRQETTSLNILRPYAINTMTSTSGRILLRLPGTLAGRIDYSD